MHVIRVQSDNSSTKRALLISKEELKILHNILTKDDDDRVALKKAKRIKEEHRAICQEMAETFNNTLLNNRTKRREKKEKLLADKITRQQENDAIIQREAMERRAVVVEKARNEMWLARDSTRMATRAEQQMQVLKERAMQIEFNKDLRLKELENKRLLNIEQNLEAEKYRKDRWEHKLNEIEMKKSKAAANHKILKEQEDRKHDKLFKLKEEEKAELQRIAKEIKEDNEKKKAQIRATRDSMVKNLEENREIVKKNTEIRILKDQKENDLLTINKEAKKKIDRTIKLRQVDLLEKRLELSNKMMEKLAHKNQENKTITNIALQKAVDQKQNQEYQMELRKQELVEKERKDLENYRNKIVEESRKEKERSAQNRQWELQRRFRETETLRDLEESRRKAKINEMNNLREHLDAQCYNNRASSMAEKQENLKEYYALVNLWRQEDEAYLAFIKKLTDKYEKAGLSTEPLQKALKDYKKNHALLMDVEVKRSSQGNPKCFTSPIVHLNPEMC